MPKLPPDPIHVQALFESAPPPLDVEALAAALAESFGRAEIVGSDDDGGHKFALHDLPAGEIEGERVPATISFLADREFSHDEALEQSLRQTWDWSEGKAIVGRATRAHHVVPLFSWAWLGRRKRLELIHGGVAAVLAQADPLALHWPHCQRLVSPSRYLELRRNVDDSLYPAANVRMFVISDGRLGDILMDTLGLAALGLPDFEIRYAGLEPADIARQLSNLAVYVFENGDVVEDGHTVEGVPPGTAWRCARGRSSVAPMREVVALS